MSENGNSDQREEEVDYSEQFQILIDFGLEPSVAESLFSLYTEGILSPEEIDQRALGALKDLDYESAITVINEMRNSDLQSVTNKSAYMCGLMKACRQKMAAGLSADHVAEAKPGPDAEKIKEILERTGYSHEVTMGQRKYGGPPPNWDSPQPGAGCEIFCGKIPPTIFEDVLIPMFEDCGPIWDLRLMIDPVTGLNKSFCFVTFTTKEGAQKAVKDLDGFEIKPGKKLKVNISVANVRLFVGNIPKNKSKEELNAEFSKIVEGLNEVIIYTNPDDPAKKNRGFAFLEFDSHKSAANAKRKLSSTLVFGVEAVVNWAEPQDEPDEEIMSKVKILYVRNLKADVTEEVVKQKFEVYGPVERVKKFKDYCFVHFEEREPAIKAMNELNKTFLNSSELLISLAKPPASNKQKKQFLNQQKFGAGGYGQSGGYGMGRGRGRGLRMREAQYGYGYSAGYGGYGYDDYGYGYDDYDYGYGYDDYDYDDSDYYGSYGYGQSSYMYPTARSRARGRVLPLRSVRPLSSLARGSSRGGARGGLRGASRPGMSRGVAGSSRGAAGRAQPRGLKRKAAESSTGAPEPKRLMQVETWETQPIVQQPLGSTEDEWYQDSWA